MKRFVSFAVLFASVAVWGQQQCPVEIVRTNSAKFVDSSTDPWNSALHIEYINHAKMKTAAIKFGVIFTNEMGEKEEATTYYVDSDHQKPEKLIKSNWSDGVYTRGGTGLKALAWVERIGFEDGSVWQDDGSRSCGLLNLYKAPKPYQAAPAAPAVSEAQKEIILANSAAANDSPAAKAADAGGHKPTPEELAELVKQGKASRMAIVSAPSGADIYVDGNKLTVTPAVFVLLKKDHPRTITVKKDGYKPVEKKFDPDGKVIPFDVTLEKE